MSSFLEKANFFEIMSIIKEITYLELNIKQKFMKFLGAKFILNVNIEMFPKVKEKLKTIELCLK